MNEKTTHDNDETRVDPGQTNQSEAKTDVPQTEKRAHRVQRFSSPKVTIPAVEGPTGEEITGFRPGNR